MQSIITNRESTALARYFTGRVEKARDTLSACSLMNYADEVCIMLPTTPPEFERFVYWAEAMRDTFDHWASLTEIRQTHSAETLLDASKALHALAADARALHSRYQARLSRGQG